VIPEVYVGSLNKDEYETFLRKYSQSSSCVYSAFEEDYIVKAFEMGELNTQEEVLVKLRKHDFCVLPVAESTYRDHTLQLYKKEGVNIYDFVILHVYRSGVQTFLLHEGILFY